MTLVVLGLDALDPDLVDVSTHPSLTLSSHRAIETIVSSSGEPSTHELWPTIITGLRPEEHGIVLDDGVAWENPLLRVGSRIANVALPETVRTRLGAWLLTNTDADAFRKPASYYASNGISTVFDGREATAIGIPNYVVDEEMPDREHQLRKHMGSLFERDASEPGGHTSSDPVEFYERCLEMTMIRIARVRRALRGQRDELVFGYTSGLDLIGHVSYDRPELQQRAYAELDEFVGELVDDLGDDDELLLVSDHGLQDGLHTEEAMVAATSEELVDDVESVLDVRAAIERELETGAHDVVEFTADATTDEEQSDRVRKQLEDLGYM